MSRPACRAIANVLSLALAVASGGPARAQRARAVVAGPVATSRVPVLPQAVLGSVGGVADAAPRLSPALPVLTPLPAPLAANPYAALRAPSSLPAAASVDEKKSDEQSAADARAAFDGEEPEPVASVSPPLDAGPASARPFAFRRYEEIVSRLSQEEGAKLHDLIATHQVIDLGRSGLESLQRWFDLLNERLSGAVKQEGRHYVTYEFYLLADADPNSWVYKHQQAGAEHGRGHVFMTTGLIARMLDTLGVKRVADITPEQTEQLLTGLAGIAAHEFAHPKQDELIKWDMRAGQGWALPAVQFDEAATDWLALRLLDRAGLPRRALLTGLGLIYGKRPAGGHAGRSLWVFLAGHPERKLRLSLAGGDLAGMRLERGQAREEPLSELGPVRKDMIAFMEQARALEETQLWSAPQADKASSEAFLTLLSDFRRYLFSQTSDPSKARDRYQAYLNGMVNLLKARGRSLDPRESAELQNLIRYMLAEKIPQLAWTPAVDSPQEARLRFVRRVTHVEQTVVYKRQKAWNELAPWAGENFERGLVEGTDWKTILPRHGGQRESAGFEALPSVMPRRAYERVYRETLSRLDERPPDDQAVILFEILVGNASAGGSPELDLAVLEKIEELRRSGARPSQAWAANFHLLFAYLDRASFNERIAAFDRAFPERKGALTAAYGRLMRGFLADPLSEGPEHFNRKAFGRGNFSGDLSSLKWPRFFEVLLWDAAPELLFYPFAGLPHNHAEIIVRLLAGTFGSVDWLRYWENSLREALPLDGEHMARLIGFFLSHSETPFNLRQRLRLYETLKLHAARGALGWDLEDARYAGYRLRLIDALSGPLRMEAIGDLFQEYGSGDILRGIGRIREVLGPQFDPIDAVFKSDGDLFVRWVQSSSARGLLDEASAGRLLADYFGTGGDVSRLHRLFSLKKDSAFLYWKHARRSGVSPEGFLDQALQGFSLGLHAANINDLQRMGFKNLVKNATSAERARVAVLPAYAGFLSHLTPVLVQDFRELLGLREWGKARDYLRRVFNPDATPIPMELKGLVDYSKLDDLAAGFVKLIPGGLTPKDYFSLWLELTAKRANRYTDEFFEERAQAHLAALGPQARARAVADILEHGRLASGRLTVSYLEEALGGEFSRLSELAARSNGPVPDHELNRFIARTESLAPRASRFKDEYLETAGWGFKLNESQLLRFIEPSKSTNHRSVNILSLNLLSSLSVMLETLNAEEKLALVRYIREPRGAVLDVVPRLGKVLDKLKERYREAAEKLRLDESLGVFETFVRDASQPQKLILLEMVVGAEGTGLYHQGEQVRERLYAMAAMERGSRARMLFEGYSESVEAHERSLLLSYLLSLPEGRGGDSLLRILEAHRAPGVKAAQMGSILAIFGEENSEALAKAKDEALKPSKLEAYRMLRAVYPEAVFRSVKNVHALLGSASIKVVLLVEFDDGSFSAVNVMRPYTQETISSTLQLARRLLENLRKKPEFSAEFDYDYGHYLKVLEHQMLLATDFKRELAFTRKLQKIYGSLKPLNGWSFGIVLPQDHRLQTDRVMHFTPIRDAVKFKDLSAADKKAASNLILRRELELLLGRGVFDADRTAANYLYVPEERRVYPIDFAEGVELERKGLLSPDDRYHLARLLNAMLAGGPSAADQLVEALLDLEDPRGGPVSEAKRSWLRGQVRSALDGETELQHKFIRVLGKAGQAGIHVPARISMGAVKGLTILMKEKYAEHADAGEVEKIIRGFLKRQGWRRAAVEAIR